MVFLSRRCQNVENVNETFINTKIRFWKHTFLEFRMYLKFLHKPRCLGWFKTSQALRHEENNVDFLERQFNYEKFPTKKTLSILFSFLFPLVLNSPQDEHEPAIFLMVLILFSKLSNPFLPLPLKGWFLLSRNFDERTCVKFAFANKVEAMYERSHVSVKVQPSSTPHLISTFYILPLFHLRD